MGPFLHQPAFLEDELTVEIISPDGQSTSMRLGMWEAASLLSQYDPRIESGWAWRLRIELPPMEERERDEDEVPFA